MEERNSLKEIIEEMRCTETQLPGQYFHYCQV